MRRLGPRWTIGLGFLTFWLLMMGLLLYRERGPELFSFSRVTASRGSDAEEVAPRETWMGLFVDDRRVGYLHVGEKPERRHGLEGAATELAVRAALNLLGSRTDFDIAGEVWRGVAEPRADFSFTVRSAEYDFQVEGRLAGGRLEAEVRSAGESLPLSFPVDEELVFASGFGTAVEFPALAVGEEVRLESFDPLSLQKTPLRVRCVDEESLEIAGVQMLLRRLEVTAGALRSQVWIDDAGAVAQIVTPFGWTLRRVDPATLDEPDPAGGDAGEILHITAVEPRGRRPFRGAGEGLYHIVSASGHELPEDRIQVALGEGRYRVTRPAAPAPGAQPDATLDRHLAADAFVQSDHPRIRRRAAAIVGTETDSWQRALAIHRWVFGQLEKEPVASIPSALEVLENRRGDCNEHTVLFTALARAAGLPARIAIGLVWSDELEGFYYHAWPEVWVNGWVWMDPTLDQPLADATHLKLLNGGIESWTGLLPHLGQLEIEVLEVR